MIEDFLGTREKKILKLLDHIIDLQCKTMSLNQLTKYLNSDIRLVLATINDYNNLELWQYGLRLEINQESLDITIGAEFSLSRLKQHLLRQSLLFLLCKTLLENSFTNLLEFSIDHFTSLSTMYRQVKLLKSLLKHYDIELNLAKQNCLSGSEKQIRHFYYELYFSVYGFSELYATDSSIDTTTMMALVETTVGVIPYPLFQKVKLFTYICLCRMTHQCHILEKPIAFSPYDIQLSSLKLNLFYSMVADAYEIKMTAEQREKELNLFVVYLLTIDIISIKKFDIINFKEINLDNERLSLANKWIKEFCAFFEVDIPPNSYFFLYINLYYFFSRKELLSSASLYNLESKKIHHILEKDNKYILEKTIKFGEHLNKHIDYPDTSATNYFNFMLIRDILFSLKRVMLSVFSSLTHSQKVNIEMKINCYSLVPVIFSETVTEEVDLIIADYYFDTEKPRLFTDVFPSKRDYDLINKKILEIYDTKKFSSYEIKQLERGQH